MKSSSRELLPGLPNDVALECLIRTPFRTLPSSCHVSRGWRAEIESPEFRHRRKFSGLTRLLIVVAQAWSDPTRKTPGSKHASSRFYRLSLCDPESGEWSDLPPVPDLPDGLPVLCHLVGLGSELVVLGGCDPVTWRALNSVFIYDFVSGKWRRGAHMPGGQRLFFGSATDSNRTVYVAGGHDEDKNALKSVLAYDVARDDWTELPDMAIERDECTGIFYSNKFRVIGGYGTEAQGRFGRDSEAFDIATRRWGPVDVDFLKSAMCQTNCVAVHEGRLYMCQNGKVMEREGAMWRAMAELPTDVRHVDYATARRGKLLVIGCAKFEEAHSAYVMDLKSYTWTKIEASKDYLGHVQSGCYLEI